MAVENAAYFGISPEVSSNRILYTPSAFARTSLLHLQEIGELRALEPHTSSRSGLQSFLFITVLSGSGQLRCDGKEYVLRSGDCAFVDCRMPYSHATGDDLWSLRWCHFFGPTMPLVYEKYLERGGRSVFKPDEVEPFLSTLDEARELAMGSDHIRDMRINQSLSGLCTLLMAESWHPGDAASAAKYERVAEVREYLERHHSERVTLDGLAARFYVDKYYLTRLFREQCGQSMSSYLTALRVTHAKRLLRFTSKTVEEIGHECGLGSPQYFSRVFRRVEGCPPSEYRRQWQSVARD